MCAASGATCTIGGTLTTAGTYTPTVSVTDGGSNSANDPLSLLVNAAPVITTCGGSTPACPSGTQGVTYSQTVVASPTGTLPDTWSISAGALPTGLTINSSTGVISGTPSATCSPCNFTARVVDVNSRAATQAFTLTIAPTPSGPTITTTTLPNSIQNVFYSQTLQATSGTLPYTWSISAGTLPTGLALDSTTGILSGGATIAGSYSFTVQVTDVNANSATQPFASFVVQPPGGAAQGVVISKGSVQ